MAASETASNRAPGSAGSNGVPAGADVPTDGWIGKCLDGRYRIEEQLGAGGVGKVYRARHLGLDRLVALKVLLQQHQQRAVSRQRFEREARALAQLSHPHIVAVTDCGMDVEVPFVVMELLVGESLEGRVRRGPLPVDLACRFALQLLDALGFVHERGLVHRDIKPSNVFLERTERGEERAKLLDFGLAKLVLPSTDAAVTRVGEVLGTPAYMAPEQITGEASDARTDVYAAGLVLFEMLAGRRAFLGSEGETLQQQMLEPVPKLGAWLRSAAVAQRLDAIVQRATSKERSERFADARAMHAALAEVSQAVAATLPGHSLPALRQSSSLRRAARPAPRAPRTGGLLRAAAVLVSGLALAAILIAGGLIYLLRSPEGTERRELLQRALGPMQPEPSGAAEPARSNTRAKAGTRNGGAAR